MNGHCSIQDISSSDTCCFVLCNFRHVQYLSLSNSRLLERTNTVWRCQKGKTCVSGSLALRCIWSLYVWTASEHGLSQQGGSWGGCVCMCLLDHSRKFFFQLYWHFLKKNSFVAVWKERNKKMSSPKAMFQVTQCFELWKCFNEAFFTFCEIKKTYKWESVSNAKYVSHRENLENYYPAFPVPSALFLYWNFKHPTGSLLIHKPRKLTLI